MNKSHSSNVMPKTSNNFEVLLGTEENLSRKIELLLHKANEKRPKNLMEINLFAQELFLKGDMCLLKEDYLSASIIFKYLNILLPENAYVKKKLAVSLIKNGNIAGSLPHLKWHYDHFKEEKVGLILAGVKTALQMEKEAEIIYLDILKRNPHSEDACIFLSKSYLSLDHKMKAKKILRKCSRNNKKLGTFDFFLGKIYLDEGSLKQAITFFKKAYQKQSSLSQSLSAWGIILEEKGQFKKVTQLYKKHLALFPQDKIILNRLVQVLFLQERYSEVIPYAEKLSDLDPEDLNLKIKLGILYTDAEQYSDALLTFKELLRYAPKSDKILYYIGSINQELHQYQESIEFFSKITPESVLYSDSSLQIANMLLLLVQSQIQSGSDDQESIKNSTIKLETFVSRKMNELSDMRIDFGLVLLNFYEGLGQFKKALSVLDSLKEDEKYSNEHRFYYANLLEKLYRFQESTNVIMGILKNEPQNAHAWNFLGYSLLERGEKLDRAYEYISKALQINPHDGYIRDSLGWYYFKRGLFKKASIELQKAHKKIPDDIEVMKHLAVVYRKMKKYKKAHTILNNALSLTQNQMDRNFIYDELKKIENERKPASRPSDK